MQTFIIQCKYGFAVINADSAEEALKLLREKEGSEEFVSFRKDVKDVLPLSAEQGIVAYGYFG